jgi:hypothetical protein
MTMLNVTSSMTIWVSMSFPPRPFNRWLCPGRSFRLFSICINTFFFSCILFQSCENAILQWQYGKPRIKVILFENMRGRAEDEIKDRRCLVRALRFDLRIDVPRTLNKPIHQSCTLTLFLNKKSILWNVATFRERLPRNGGMLVRYDHEELSPVVYKVHFITPRTHTNQDVD